MKFDLLSTRQSKAGAILIESLLESIDLKLLIINQIDKNNNSNFPKSYMNLLSRN